MPCSREKRMRPRYSASIWLNSVLQYPAHGRVRRNAHVREIDTVAVPCSREKKQMRLAMLAEPMTRRHLFAMLLAGPAAAVQVIRCDREMEAIAARALWVADLSRAIREMYWNTNALKDSPAIRELRRTLSAIDQEVA